MRTMKLCKWQSEQDVFFFSDFGFNISENKHGSCIAQNVYKHTETRAIYKGLDPNPVQ